MDASSEAAACRTYANPVAVPLLRKSLLRSYTPDRRSVRNVAWPVTAVSHVQRGVTAALSSLLAGCNCCTSAPIRAVHDAGGLREHEASLAGALTVVCLHGPARDGIYGPAAGQGGIHHPVLQLESTNCERLEQLLYIIVRCHDGLVLLRPAGVTAA